MFVPVITIQDNTNKRHLFTWSSIYNAHIWNRGDLGPEDSVDLDNILSTNCPYYRPTVILRPDDVEAPKVKNKGGRPRKLVVA